jgi:hypothetical protein
MARPIKETPTIRGKDSIRFQEAIDNPIPLFSAAEKEERKQTYEFMKSIATFPMP